ncbi:MAG: acetylxylan esterase [Chloroflexi bacterium]|nr:acetylxylan esterase [Chloroflexota bacterium]MDA1270895.1 acetylxylan esterase [Chloroflexota bacterium]
MTTSADRFWQQTEAALAEFPLELHLERDAFYSQPDWDVFRMRYRSADGYWLFAWLSAPKGNGPFPAVVRMPDYGSVQDIVYTPLRERAVVLNPTFRGQRRADTSFQAQFPGLLTDGIDRPETYVMRRVFADALRGVDAVSEQAQAPIRKIAVTGSGLGGSLALAAAAHRLSVDAVAANTPMALGNPVSLEPGLAYPLAELDDYLRLNPTRRDAVEQNTSDLDPVKTAFRITAPVLLSVGINDTGSCPLAFGEELAARIPHCDLRVYHGGPEGGGHEHAQIQLSWVADQLGLG